MEEYLRRPHVPDFLKPISTASTFHNVNLSDPKKYYNANYKYHQYFANLNNNITGNSTFYPNDTFSYYKNHKVYRPALNYNPTNNNDIKEINHSKYKKEKKSFQSYDSFLNVPTLFSDMDLSGLSYHTAVDMPDGIYLFGGLTGLSMKEYEERLKFITKNFTIPPQNIKIICDYDLPLPLDKQKFESISLTPHRCMSKYLPDSKSLRYVCSVSDDINENFIDIKIGESTNQNTFINDKKNNHSLNLKGFTRATENPSSNTTTISNTSSLLNSCPKSMICSGGAKLSERFFMIYGGLEIDTKISFPDNNHCIIEKTLTPNDQFWLFDRIKCHFREIKLSVHPTYSTIFPNSIPRFGHTMNSVPIEDDKTYIESSNSVASMAANSISKNNSSEILRLALNSSYSKPATIFVMGGYKLNENGKSFISMNDLWKCDFFLDENGTADEAIACPIGDFNVANDVISYIIDENMNQLQNKTNLPRFTGVFSHSTDQFNWPAPRGFHSTCLVESSKLSRYLDWKKIDNENINENNEHFSENNINNNDSNLEQLKMMVPIPTKKSQLNYIHSNENNGISDLKSNENNIKEIKSNNNNLNLTSKSEFKIKNLFNKPDFKVGSTVNTARSINTISSGSPINEAIGSSHSPYSANYIHTNTNTAINNKVLVISGGSSILYTKVVNDKLYDVFYNNTIRGDIWIFDFQTEKWYSLSKISNIEKTISLCGHNMFISDTALMMFGGIEDKNYSDETYNVFQAGIYEDNNSSKDEMLIQKLNWVKGKEIAQKFHNNLRIEINIKSKSIIDGIDMNRNKILNDYNYYSNYELILQQLKWRVMKVAVVQNLVFFGPWDSTKNLKITCGGMVDNDSIKEKEILFDKKIIYTHCPAFMKDSKIIMFSPDVKVVDRITGKYIPGAQKLIGNGVCEIFSVNL